MITRTPARMWRYVNSASGWTSSETYDEIRWHRWSEWDVFPEDHISRTAGVARATRDAKWGATNAPESRRPTWPWSLDQTDLGTNDFRAIKFNIYGAVLRSPTGAGVEVRAKPMRMCAPV